MGLYYFISFHEIFLKYYHTRILSGDCCQNKVSDPEIAVFNKRFNFLGIETIEKYFK